MKVIPYSYNKMGDDYYISPEQAEADSFLVTAAAFKAIEAFKEKPEMETLIQFLHEQAPNVEQQELEKDAQRLLDYLKSLNIIID
ncbi:MAG: hypothetical protein GQ569_08450 [Methylococcaceae bacterium]|nr:hypothetical protein [Methylococcaceae bacterium]